jgi:hypothetical protein
MEYAEYLRALVDERPDLAAELADLRGLGGVMDWMRSRGLALADVEIVRQDEFSLDFVVPLAPGGEHLAFGIT